jgi:restriction system protein
MKTLTSNAPIRGVHAGKTGDAASLSLSKNCVALGWLTIGDLPKLASSRIGYSRSYNEII